MGEHARQPVKARLSPAPHLLRISRRMTSINKGTPLPSNRRATTILRCAPNERRAAAKPRPTPIRTPHTARGSASAPRFPCWLPCLVRFSNRLSLMPAISKMISPVLRPGHGLLCLALEWVNRPSPPIYYTLSLSRYFLVRSHPTLPPTENGERCRQTAAAAQSPTIFTAVSGTSQINCPPESRNDPVTLTTMLYLLQDTLTPTIALRS